MVTSVLEHVNVTVRDPKASAEEFSRLFDWRVRWFGDAIHGGTSYHVGGDDSYVALYAEGSPPAAATVGPAMAAYSFTFSGSLMVAWTMT